MNEEVQNEMPYITIDDVQLSIEDLPAEGQAIFGRLQRLNQKKANMTLDLEEIQASINFFSSRIVEIVNSEGEEEAEVDIAQTDAFPPEED